MSAPEGCTNEDLKTASGVGFKVQILFFGFLGALAYAVTYIATVGLYPAAGYKSYIHRAVKLGCSKSSKITL